MSEHPELSYLDAPLHRRKAYANAADADLNVRELKPQDPRANAELNYLMKQLYVTDRQLTSGDRSVIYR